MIADFNNHTGDPIFDGTLESTLKLALEGAGFISAYDHGQLRNLGVPPSEQPKGRLDEAAAAKIAVAWWFLEMVANHTLSFASTQWGCPDPA